MLRYVRAALRAFNLTLRRESPNAALLRKTHPLLADWCDATLKYVDEMLKTAHAEQVDPEKITARIDGRVQSMAVILAGVRFHAEQEYGFLLAGGDPHAALALQAINLNDRFAVNRLTEILPPKLQSAAKRLQNHLDNLPALSEAIVQK